jgi:hypothetical protein
MTDHYLAVRLRPVGVRIFTGDHREASRGDNIGVFRCRSSLRRQHRPGLPDRRATPNRHGGIGMPVPPPSSKIRVGGCWSTAIPDDTCCGSDQRG